MKLAGRIILLIAIIGCFLWVATIPWGPRYSEVWLADVIDGQATARFVCPPHDDLVIMLAYPVSMEEQLGTQGFRRASLSPQISGLMEVSSHGTPFFAVHLAYQDMVPTNWLQRYGRASVILFSAYGSTREFDAESEYTLDIKFENAPLGAEIWLSTFRAGGVANAY